MSRNRGVGVAVRYCGAGATVGLLLRGVSGMVASGRAALGHRTRVPIEYVHWDLVLYSPLCLALGAVAAAVVWRGRWSAGCPAGAR